MNSVTFLNFGRLVSRLPIANYFKSLYINRVRWWYKNNLDLFRGKIGIEVGGPSPIFTHKASIPTYSHAYSIDNVNWSSNTLWSSHNEGGPFAPYKGSPLGREYIFDSTEFPESFDGKYDFMQCSHVLEHIANPAKAILSWRKILKKNGVAIIIVPNKKFTYDIDRPFTSLEHLVGDYISNVSEDDNTHFSEIIQLHNFAHDNTYGGKNPDRTAWATEVNNNLNSRKVHHHCFSGDILVDLVTLCGFRVIELDMFLPHHIAVIAVRTDEQPDILHRD